MTNEQINEYSNLIYSITKFFPNYKNKEDLYQAGYIGLLTAYQNYDPTMNTKFSSYAYLYILGEMKKQIREDKTIKISRNITKLYLQLEKAKILLAQKLMREPSIDEISSFLEIDRNLIIECQNSINSVQSLDEPIEMSENSMSLYEVIGSYENVDDHIMLKDELKKLPQDELDLIKNRYIYNLSQTEIANNLGMTQVQVSRKEAKIKQKLKEKLIRN